MEPVLKILGRVGLALTILPSILFLTGTLQLATVKIVMLIGTVLWLVAAPMVQKLNKEATTGE
ncbi:MAG: hypothetical protein AB3N64_04765 [Puniceicoccaceae bacterium]